MLNKLRSFSKGRLATVLVAIIIIPFVFWGMGSVFSGGNTNSIAKINNYNISTKDLISHINNSNLDREKISKNIDNSIIEDLVSDLVSTSIIDIEIKNLNLIVSDKNLIQFIKKNNNFLDPNGEFSRIKYEKFLLENNLSAAQFEYRFKNNELKRKLFQYISGGIKSPYFLTNKLYKDNTKKIDISYLDLNNIYKKKESFTDIEINKFINANKDKLKNDYIDFSYAKLTPMNLVKSDEYNNEFFATIDKIENEILNGKKIAEIALKYNIKILNVLNYFENKNDNKLFNEIYKKRNEEIVQLVDKNDYFLLYEITKKENKLPKKDKSFINLVKSNIFESEKYKLNKELFDKIQNKQLSKEYLNTLVNNKNLIKNKLITSINNNDLFSDTSMKLIYSMTKNHYLLMVDNDNNVYLVYINNIVSDNINKFDQEIMYYKDQSNIQIRKNLYNTYDLIMNEKYKVKLNQKTLDRVKNHFR